MRWPIIILTALLLLLQYPLWFGKGGWWHVQDEKAQLDSLREANQKLEQRNANAAAEVKDLKAGFDAIEERARFELGFIKPGEVFVQTADSPPINPPAPPSKKKYTPP
ncbi:cell division protein FtsB [Uliginosibacterium sediminicola]|uniref:Cell division protein FtsB n=1 Tax=Uliginosibacterium sediminicola TaxID=2024550 RepID=A0ABU9Z3X5_9RHOO